MKIAAVIFDLDGTIIDSPLDFDAIRAEIGLPPGVDILQGLASLEEPDRSHAHAILVKHERRAAARARLREGAGEVLALLRARGLKIALLTRNSSKSVRMIKKRLQLELDAEATRDTIAAKPSPEGVYRIAADLGIDPEKILMVGDYLFDMQTGKAAGTRTAFLKHQHNPPPEADYVLEKLVDIIPLLELE